MSKLPPVGSGEWWDYVGMEAITQAFELVWKPMVLRAMESGYPPTAQPVTLKTLLAQDPAKVGQQLAGMIRNPMTSAKGTELLRAYVEAMAKRPEPAPAPVTPMMGG